MIADNRGGSAGSINDYAELPSYRVFVGKAARFSSPVALKGSAFLKQFHRAGNGKEARCVKMLNGVDRRSCVFLILERVGSLRAATLCQTRSRGERATYF